jgi:hypothetical protein
VLASADAYDHCTFYAIIACKYGSIALGVPKPNTNGAQRFGLRAVFCSGRAA